MVQTNVWVVHSYLKFELLWKQLNLSLTNFKYLKASLKCQMYQVHYLSSLSRISDVIIKDHELIAQGVYLLRVLILILTCPTRPQTLMRNEVLNQMTNDSVII